ncbi:azurin [Antarcticibacterium flavum]|uniref:Azurin n=1 Tax=Antarcticibacterium flavum TaxID=2058175 RepID=A0A5B7X1N5_9FLAO|nr:MULTISPECIES: azurin [Antarcticibacterium]MCM4158715.1 azurin [Antarcticibacterium sp. W02-3]QCY68568.1 azurin [Antarcticibacterium flavum]
MNTISKILFLLAATVLISCGEKKEEEEEKVTIGNQNRTESSTTSSTRSQEATTTEGDVAEVTLGGNDQMQFDKKEIRVKAGQTVRLTFRHTGQMAKNVMGHNFVLLTQGTNINEFGQAAVKFPDNDYIPEDKSNVIAHTKMLGGGETTTIEFEAPEAGTYDYICSFPGHYAIMQGKFIVE